MNKIIAALGIALLVAGVACAANEITAVGTLKINKGYLDYTRAVNTQFTITNAFPNVGGLTQLMNTNAWTEITIGDVSLKGWSWFRNLGSNGNDIALGAGVSAGAATEFLRLKGGEFMLAPLGTNKIWGISLGTNEATTVLDKIISDR